MDETVRDIPLPDGRQVDLMTFQQECAALHGYLAAYQKASQTLDSMQSQARRLADKIRRPDEPDGIFGKKKKMRQQQKECSEKLFDLQLQMEAHMKDRVQPSRQAYEQALPHLIPEPYRYPDAVEFLCYAVKKEVAGNLKVALALYHKYLQQQELQAAHEQGRQMQYQHQKRMDSMQRSMNDMRRQIDAYTAQNQQNLQAVRDNITSIWISDVSQGKTPPLWTSFY